MSKQKIREWLKKNYPDMVRRNENVEFVSDIIHQYIQSQWINSSIEPEDTCYVWVKNAQDKFEIIEFYRCPEYENGIWQQLDGEDVDFKFDRYSIISEPE